MNLLDKIFQNLEMPLTFKEAKEKAFLFLECVKYTGEELACDYWIQLSKEWDLNISDGDIVLYPIVVENGYFVTDTSTGTRLEKNR